jgi:hypothetical protein
MADISKLTTLSDKRLKETVSLSVPLNLVYLLIPKSGCTTVMHALWEAIGGPQEAKLAEDGEFEEPYGFKYLPADLNALEAEPFVFTITRNPFKRIYSTFHDKIQFRKFGNYNGTTAGRLMRANTLFPDPTTVSFSDFLEVVAKTKDEDRDAHWRSLSYQTNADMVEPDLICDISAIIEAMATVAERVGLKTGFNVEHKNERGSTKFIVEAYTPECERLVRECFAEDFERFGYSTKLDDAL